MCIRDSRKGRILFQLLAQRGRAAALPHNGIVNRLACFPVSYTHLKQYVGIDFDAVSDDAAAVAAAKAAGVELAGTADKTWGNALYALSLIHI